jgi:transposase
MWIIGCDFHGRYQQVAAMNEETGEVIERRLSHETKEAEAFYESLPRGALIGMEASCTAQWFERLMDRCGHRLQVGDPATIRASVVRKQKTDARDARQLLELLLTGRFPSIWIPTPAERDVRQLLVHRHHLVRWRTQVRNQLSALARSQGIFPRTRFWTQAGRQKLDEQIADLTRQVEQQARARNDAFELMQQDGVGPIVSLAFVLTLGTAKRFRRGKQVASYLGLNPRERSSGGTQRFGHISKQGNRMMRWLLVEAAWIAVRKDPELQRVYRRLAFRRGRKIAAVAVARKLAVKLYWRLRDFEAKNVPAAAGSDAGQLGQRLVHSSTL